MKNLFSQFILSLLVAFYAISAMPAFDPGDTFSNCISPLTKPSCTGFLSRAGFRTINGTCNNLRFPTAGAANTPLRRLLKAQYTDNFDTPRGFPGTSPVIPTANQVSEELFKVENQNKGTGDLAVMFMTMGQFLDHDMSFSPEGECHIEDCSSQDAFKYPCFPIPFENGGSECTSFGRAVPVCQGSVKKRRNQLNSLTAFVDGSHIYGITVKQHERVRKRDGTGQLRLTSNGLLPIDEERLPCSILGGCSLVGDNRGDENIALHSMHTLWAREHNRIAKELKVINPSWKEEDLYQNARKIVGGMLQHIIYEEWLPNIVRLPKYKGYNRWLNPTLANAFTTAAFRFGHSLVPNKFSLLNGNFDDVRSPIELQAAFRNRQLIVDTGIEPTLLGLAGNRSNNVDNGFAFGIVRKLFIRPGQNGRMDLTARNIQRGRDHGIPTYGNWRRACRLPTVKTFDDLEALMLKGTVDVFKKIYSSPEDIDLFAAGISEKHIPGLQVGPTFECLFRYQYSRLRDADRFFYCASGVFTASQFNALTKVTMARVLCNNLNGIVSVQPQAFKVDTAAKNKRIACENIPKLDLSAWKQ